MNSQKEKIIIVIFILFLILSLFFKNNLELQKKDKIDFSNLVEKQNQIRKEKQWIEYREKLIDLKNKGCVKISFNSGECSLLDESCGKVEKPIFDFHCSKWISQHIKKPENIKAIYYTAYSASRKSKIDRVIKLTKEKKINSVIIDIKEVDGKVSFDMSKYKFGKIRPKSNLILKDIDKILEELHKNNVYVIGRIVVFKDQMAAKQNQDLVIKDKKGKVWSDRKGKKYIDPTKKEFWDYIVNLSRAIYLKGFDEINYDYIRYPSDGRMSEIDYNLKVEKEKWGRVENLDKFFNYLTTSLKKEFPEIELSGDLFGQTALAYDDQQIGQLLDDAVLYFDRVAPMTYPSHYNQRVFGLRSADSSPYFVLKKTAEKVSQRIDELNEKIKKAKENGEKIELRKGLFASVDVDKIQEIKKEKIVFWLQGFTCTWCQNHIYYGRNEIQKQIKGIEEEGYKSWMIWNAASRYGNWF